MGAMFAFAGTMAAFAPHRAVNAAPAVAPPLVFIIFASFFGFIFVISAIFIALEFYAASCLKKRRNLIVIQIVAGLYCISLPWGTAVGVCTFMVLGRPSVRALFN